MKQRLKFLRRLTPLFFFALSACDGGGSPSIGPDRVQNAPPSERSLLSVTPSNDETGVSLNSLLSLDFEGEGLLPELLLSELDSSKELPLNLIEDFEGRTTYKMAGLEKNKQYRLYISATQNTPVRTIDFRTAPLPSNLGQAPALVQNSVDDTSFPLSDRSSYYFVYSEWLDPDSLQEATIRLSSASGEHQTRTLINRENMVVSPSTPLPNAGPWTLSVSGIYDLSGTPAADYKRQFTVEPLGTLSRINVASYEGPGRQSVAEASSSLIGDSTITFDSETGVYLGDPIKFDGYQPVLIKRGSEFKGNSIQVKLGGEIETSLNTGPLRFTVLNDSVGYIQKNPLTDSFESPQSTELVIDLGVAATDTKANGILTQYLINGRANGLSKIVDGQLVFTLISTTELDVLESGNISANLDLVLNTVEQQTTDFTDSQAPALRASLPKDGNRGFKTDDTIVLLFDEALAPESLDSRITLRSQAGDNVAVNWRAEGGRVLVKPRNPLAALTDYTISIGAGISDIAGNTTSRSFSSQFQTQADSREFIPAPRIEGLIPGVACQLVETDLTANIAGHCKVPEGGNRSQAYSLFEHPSNQPMELWLNSLIDPASAYAATSCDEVAPISLQRVDWSGGQPVCKSIVASNLVLNGNNMRLIPGRDLVEGGSYQLVIHAGTDGRCDSRELCGLNGKPADLDPFDGEITTGGGRDIKIPFIAVKADKGDTYQPLVSETRTDINANRIIDLEETSAPGSSISLKMDLCDASECTNPYLLRTPICAYPGAQPTDPAYSCNADAARTEAFLKARFAGNSFSYSDSILPITIGTPETDPETGGKRIPVTVPPAIQFSTSTTLVIEALIDIPAPTGAITFRFLQDGTPGSSKASRGYIRTDQSSGNESKFSTTLDVLVDAPELEIPTGGNHNLKNRRISVTLSSLVSFTREGQIRIELRNDTPIKLPVTITDTILGVADGDIVFEVPVGAFKLDVVSR